MKELELELGVCVTCGACRETVRRILFAEYALPEVTAPGKC
jgi:bacterioferritin-associated ferredoxin